MSTGRPKVDMFATCHNNKMRRYVSPVPDENAWEIDALNLDWKGSLTYMFPPWNMLAEVLLKIADDQAEVILIAPKWERRNWYPLLQDMLLGLPMPLPKWEDLLKQPHSGKTCNHLKRLDLHAWRLSGKAVKN